MLLFLLFKTKQKIIIIIWNRLCIVFIYKSTKYCLVNIGHFHLTLRFVFILFVYVSSGHANNNNKLTIFSALRNSADERFNKYKISLSNNKKDKREA